MLSSVTIRHLFRLRRSSIINIHLITYSFIHSFIHSFIYSFIHSFIHSFAYLFIHSFAYLFIHAFVYLFIHSFIYSFIHSFIYSFIRSTVHLFDSKRALLSERNVSFSTSNPCTCEVMGCRCEVSTSIFIAFNGNNKWNLINSYFIILLCFKCYWFKLEIWLV